MEETGRTERTLSRINVLVKLGRDAQAIEECDDIIRRSGDDPEVRFKKGVLYLKLRKFGNAVMEFERAITLDPAVPIYHYGKAQALNRLEEYGKSLHEINEVLRLVSVKNHKSANENGGEGVTEEVEKLIRHFEEMGSNQETGIDMAMEPDSDHDDEIIQVDQEVCLEPETYLETDFRELPDDIRSFDDALKRINSYYGGSSISGSSTAGIIIEKEKRLAAAMETPPTGNIGNLLIYNAGILRIDPDRSMRRELRKMNALIEQNPEDPELHYGKALYLYTRGQFAQARSEIDAALEIRGDVHSYIFGKRLIDSRIEEMSKAEENLSEILDEAPANASNHYRMGILLHLQCRFMYAENEFNRAIELYGLDPRFYLARAVSRHASIRKE